MFAVIVHNIVGGNEYRHISSCFTRQIRVYIPVARFPARFSDSAGNIPRSAVVGSYHQMPIVVYGIQISQITNGCLRRLFGVEPVVYQRIDLQVVHLCRPYHKLPKTSRSGTRYGFGVQSRFYYRQIFQLHRQVVFSQNLLEYGKIVALAQTYHILYLIDTLGIFIYKKPHNIIVRHLYTIWQFLQSCYINAVAVINGSCLGAVTFAYYRTA